MNQQTYLISIKPRVDACLAKIQPTDEIAYSYGAIYILKDKTLYLIDSDDGYAFATPVIVKKKPPTVSKHVDGRRFYPKAAKHEELFMLDKPTLQALTPYPDPHEEILFRLSKLRFPDEN